MDEMILEFQIESKSLVGQLMEILEAIEGDCGQYKRLEEYGQIIDRIMGTATSLAMASPEMKTILEMAGKYGELCKVVSYKGSQVANNEGLYNAVVSLLLDATEMLQEIIENLRDPQRIMAKTNLTITFMDRLRWLSERFPADLRRSLATGGLTPASSIEDLLKKFTS